MSLSVTKSSQPPSILTRSVFLGQIFLAKVLYDKKTYILIFVSILPLLPYLNTTTASISDYISIIAIGEETNIFNFLIMPLICLILGISAISDEKENKTISQFLSRPVKREEIVLIKWITLLIIGVVIACLDALIIYLGLCIIVNDFTILFEHLDVLLGAWLFVGLWVVIYSTIFLLLGIVIDKNALGWGLAIAYFEAFFGQFIFGPVIGGENSPYSIANHIYQVTAEYFLMDYFEFSIANFEPLNSLIVCITLIIGFLLLSMFAMRRKDFP
ncbi:MAG: ABC transporter permease subunit [Candidatus Hodarchaeales archaeon]|jgi:ABC-type transport system involved in multi-copper enzyme maturation permease subunit